MGMYNLGVRTIDEIQTRFLNKEIHSQSVDSFESTLKDLYNSPFFNYCKNCTYPVFI